MVRRYVNQQCIFVCTIDRIPIHENFSFKNCFETVINLYCAHKTLYFLQEWNLSLFPYIYFYRSAIIEINTFTFNIQ